MPDTKITALAAITTVDPAADVLPIVDISDTSMAASGTTKKITSNQILGAGGTATLASATISGDLTVDTNTLKVDSANNRVGIGTASPISQFANTNTTDTITGTVTDGFAWRSLSNDWAATIISRPASGNAYALRAHTGGATASDYPLWLSAGASSGNTVFAITGNGVFTFADGAGGTRMTLNSTGLNIANGNLILGTSGTGIDFSATTSGSGTMTSELLNDYEEGTWTPTVGDASSGGNQATTATAVGRYTKIGRLVTVQWEVTDINTTGLTAGNALYIRGLPFASSSATTQFGTPAVSGVTFSGYLTAGVFSGSSFPIYSSSSGGSLADIKVSAVASGTADIWGTLTYIV